MIKNCSLILALIFMQFYAISQRPFEKDIEDFKSRDKENPPEKGQILFIGSSSFTLWKDVQDYFPGKKILNRGFGGSSLTHLIEYANDIIFPYEPSQIVIYSGENDIAGGASAQVTYERFKTVYRIIREKLPEVPMLYVSMKPSPSRMKYYNEMTEANKMISDFIKKEKNIKYVDVHSKMMKKNYPISEIFTADSLHMNAKGYQIWKKKIQPHLIKQ
jgi:lysophospholipase L1-like esterase